METNNTYRFVIDTDNIKSDNIFTIIAPTFQVAKEQLLDTFKILDFTYLNVVLVYTDDSKLKDII